MRDMFTRFIALLFSAQSDTPRRPTREEIQERERQAALRDLERIKYMREHNTAIPDLPRAEFLWDMGRGCGSFLARWLHRDARS